MDEPRPGHRLDDGRDRLGVDLVDPAGEPPQRVDVGRDDELIEMLSPLGEQADIELLATEIESGMQHLRWASLVRFGWWTTERLTHGGPSSWQSKAAQESVAQPVCSKPRPISPIPW
jgi:hypothetical protein